MCYLVFNDNLKMMLLPALMVGSREVLTNLNATVETGAASAMHRSIFCSQKSLLAQHEIEKAVLWTVMC